MDRGERTWLVERSLSQARSGLAAHLDPDERVLSAVPVAFGLHPQVINVPMLLALVVIVLSDRTPNFGLFTLVAGGGALLTQVLTKPRRLVLTNRRLVTCTVNLWTRPNGVERSDHPATVTIEDVRGGFPFGSLAIVYPGSVRVRGWVPKIWLETARRLASRLGGAAPIPPMPRA